MIGLLNKQTGKAVNNSSMLIKCANVSLLTGTGLLLFARYKNYPIWKIKNNIGTPIKLKAILYLLRIIWILST